MKKIVAIMLVFASLTALCVPAYATDADSVEPSESSEVVWVDSLFDDVEPISEETTIKDGRKITVTTYILENGDVVTDTFERGVNLARTYSGSDSATRTVKFDYITITLTGKFRWWTSSGTAGQPGSWQSVECTSASAKYTINNNNYGIRNWAVTHSDGAIKAGKAWARAYGFVYALGAEAVGKSNYLTIYCDDEGRITDKNN